MNFLRTHSTKLLALFAVSALMLAMTPPVQDLVLEQVAKADGMHLGSPSGGVRGQVNIDGDLIFNKSSFAGAVALSSASPSTATVLNIRAGSRCSCWPVGATAAIAAGGCAASLSSTTLTLTGPNTVTTTMNYFCF